MRNRVRTDARGRPQLIRTPLSEEDVLHPREADHINQNEGHTDDRVYLMRIFQEQFARKAGALVLCNHAIKWDVAGMKNHGPDIAVILGLPPRPPRRPSFRVAREGARPELIVEITSPATYRIDLDIKPGQYWLCGVPYYVIVAEIPQRRRRQLQIIGYRHGERGYRRMRLNAKGWLWLETVQLWLGQEKGRVACFDKNGRRIRTYVEIEIERQREEERLRQAQAEIARLQSELRRLRRE